MTAKRARAYSRLMGLIDGEAAMRDPERAQLRRAADELVFAAVVNESIHEAWCDARAVTHGLVQDGRCRPGLVGRLLAALAGCAPDDHGPDGFDGGERFARPSLPFRAYR
jgi:hypothetical protein